MRCYLEVFTLCFQTDVLTLTAGHKKDMKSLSLMLLWILGKGSYVIMSGRMQVYEYKAFALQTCKKQARTVHKWVKDYRIRCIKTIKISASLDTQWNLTKGMLSEGNVAVKLRDWF
jgi:hypothetical protein